MLIFISYYTLPLTFCHGFDGMSGEQRRCGRQRLTSLVSSRTAAHLLRSCLEFYMIDRRRNLAKYAAGVFF